MNSFPRVKLEDTVSFGEHIISKDKYTSILSGEMEASVFITLQLILITCGRNVYECLTVCDSVVSSSG